MLSSHAILYVPSEAGTGGVVRAFDSHGGLYSIQLPPLKGQSFVAVRLPPDRPHNPAPDDAYELVQSTITSLVSAGHLQAGLCVPQCAFPPYSPLTMNIRSACTVLTNLSGRDSSSADITHYLSLLKALLKQAEDLNQELNSHSPANWQPGETVQASAYKHTRRTQNHTHPLHT